MPTGLINNDKKLLQTTVYPQKRTTYFQTSVTPFRDDKIREKKFLMKNIENRSKLVTSI